VEATGSGRQGSPPWAAVDNACGGVVRPPANPAQSAKTRPAENSFNLFSKSRTSLVITVAGVVVTRNRPALLKRCLAAIDAQTFPVSHLIVVDNASELPTRELLAAETARRDASFRWIELKENSGGAGGFHAGMQASLSLPCTHLWLMDDDCEPDPRALEELIAAARVVGEDAVLGSNIFDLNGESINVQPVAFRLGLNGVPQYPLHLEHGLVEMCTLTFVSFLVSTNLVRKAGLPLKEFFIWGDDTEYSLRIARFARLYQVGKSKVTHLKSGDASQNVYKESRYDRIWQYRLFYRNRMYIIYKYDGVFSAPMGKFVFRSLRDMFLSILNGKFILMKCKAIGYGLCARIGFSLRMEKKESAGPQD
jgi:GT2 family glycosyltransferase